MNGRRNLTVREQSLQVWNSTSNPLSLILEPWAEEYTVPPGSGVDLIGRGPAEGRFEVGVRDDGIAVYGWTGSVVQVFKDGEILEPFGDGARTDSASRAG